MQAAGRRTMPRPAVGVRPSTSCYAPAVPRGLRPCREGCGGLAFYIRDGRRRGARISFTTSNFFQMSTLIRLRRTAHLPGGTEGVLFFPAESGQSPMATLEPPASGAHPAIPAANIRSASTWFRHALPARPVDGRRPGGRDCRA